MGITRRLIQINSLSLLNFDDDDVDVGGADVLDGVGRVRRGPGDGRTGFGLSAIKINVAVGVAANHVGAAEDVLHSGPAVRVYRDGSAGRNDDVENSDVFVLENEAMEVGRGDEGVKMGGRGRSGHGFS